MKPPPGANDLWVCVNPACKEREVPKWGTDTSREGHGFTEVKCGWCWQPCEQRPMPVQT